MLFWPTPAFGVPEVEQVGAPVAGRSGVLALMGQGLPSVMRWQAAPAEAPSQDEDRWEPAG